MVGYCLSSTGQYGEARTWFERAVAAKEQGDVHGRNDHESLCVTLLYGAELLRKLGDTETAVQWEKRASELGV